MSGLPPVCILAGGLGTRLGERVRDTPKPLIQVAGEPFLMHQLRLLAGHGASRIVLCVGYLGEEIEARIGSELFGMRIEYSFDGPGLDGTLGAIIRARALLGERFLVLYGDTYLRVDYRAAASAWEHSGLPAMMSVLRNEGRWDDSNANFENDRVLAYDKFAPTQDMHWIDYGLGGLTAEALLVADPDEHDLAHLYHRLAASGALFGYEARERFFEIGTARGLAETDAFLAAPGMDGRAVREVDEDAERAHSRGLLGLLSSHVSSRSSLVGQGVRFAAAGGMVALVYLGVTTVLSSVFGVPFQIALAIGFCTGLVLHFTLQRAFVWRHEQEYALPLHSQVRRYLLVAGLQYAVTAASTSLLPPILGVPTEIVYLATVAVILAFNFLVFRTRIFHPHLAEGGTGKTSARSPTGR